MNKYYDIKVDGYERVVKCVNEKENFVSFISIHNTKLGPALGGCRLLNYESIDLALADALSLSRAMTFKSCMANLDQGGGKCVISGNINNKHDILKYIGDFVNYFKGSYIIAEDVNVNCNDLDIVREVSPYVANKIAGDPGPITAKGVYLGIKESWKFLNKINFLKKFEDAKILIYGVGSVGSALVNLLAKEMKKIYIYDINMNVVDAMLNKYTNIYFEKDPLVMMTNFDILVPCALGGFITKNFSKKVEAKLIAGSANNQLATSKAGKILFSRNILYAPDYVINAGGVIQIAGIKENTYDENIVEKKLKIIPKNLKKIYKKSFKEKIPTNIVADKMVMEKLFLC